jgi:hypothetical protein
MRYRVWVIELESTKPVRLVTQCEDSESALLSAARVVRGLGAVLLSAQNVTWHGEDSLLVYDPSGCLPLATVVVGLSVVEEDLSPITAPLTPVATRPALSE